MNVSSGETRGFQPRGRPGRRLWPTDQPWTGHRQAFRRTPWAPCLTANDYGPKLGLSGEGKCPFWRNATMLLASIRRRNVACESSDVSTSTTIWRCTCPWPRRRPALTREERNSSRSPSDLRWPSVRIPSAPPGSPRELRWFPGFPNPATC